VGDKMFARIERHYRGQREDGTPLKAEYAGEEWVWLLREDRKILQDAGYWQIARNIVGDDPNQLDIWHRYEQVDDPAIREAFRRSYPRLRQIEKVIRNAKTRMKQRILAVDKALIRWYGHRATHPENRAEEVLRIRAAQGSLRAR